jgi:hypothetical protein
MSISDATQRADALPHSSRELLKLLSICTQQMKMPVDEGQFGLVIGPTILGKEIALALENGVSELGARRGEEASTAIRRLVLAAWELDYFSDTGNREKLTEAFSRFSAAIVDISNAYDFRP